MLLRTLSRVIPLALIAFLTIPNGAFALEENGAIDMPFSDNAPTIDGKWTTEDEWLDASVTEMSEQGHTIFLLIKHDRDYIYFMFDAVTDQSEAGLHFASLFFDSDNSGGSLDSNDIWIPYGIAYDSPGRVHTIQDGNKFHVGNSETNDWTPSFEPKGFDHAFSTVSKNSAYESGREHYIHEFRVPISYLHKQDTYGFGAFYYVGPIPLSNQIVVHWPPDAQKSEPSLWGSLISPTGSVTAPPAPVMTVSTKELSFANTVVSEKSTAKTVTIENRGTSDLKISNVRVTGEFSVTGIDLPAMVGPGESTTLQIISVPLSLGDKSGTLSIVSNDLTYPTYTVMLEGKGVEKGEILAGGGCLIATAAYGSEFAPQVQMLREIRDNQLLKTSSGFAFMSAFNSFYYSWSPTVAEWERENPAFKEFVRMAITPLITTLSILPHVSMDTEQEALGYGIGIITLNIGIYFVGPAFAVIFARSWIRGRTHQ